MIAFVAFIEQFRVLESNSGDSLGLAGIVYT
jgi:hypothetical protein